MKQRKGHLRWDVKHQRDRVPVNTGVLGLQPLASGLTPRQQAMAEGDLCPDVCPVLTQGSKGQRRTHADPHSQASVSTLTQGQLTSC